MGARLGRAMLLQIARSEQDRNLCLAWGAKEKISEGDILLFSANPGGVGGRRCVPEAAPRPEPWSLGARVGISPAAT